VDVWINTYSPCTQLPIAETTTDLSTSNMPAVKHVHQYTINQICLFTFHRALLPSSFMSYNLTFTIKHITEVTSWQLQYRLGSRYIQVIKGSKLVPKAYYQVSDTQTARCMNSRIWELWSRSDWQVWSTAGALLYNNHKQVVTQLHLSFQFNDLLD